MIIPNTKTESYLGTPASIGLVNGGNSSIFLWQATLWPRYTGAGI